ncbi:uncharacterized protein RCC_04901 [Ramularia collo-cygni]|uniref:Uncharacterized protein n=1 Tax=Ramularia collo-cygni TaxID=112498 RepID=A0A2D3UXJ3_9PEZI|nr:uncharacterized protein RCC_04901 [Ramularia collo-cygni]CZT19055.1 uncharacterized protein RCC_04901 [Ramularia collo-cygni]
MGIPSFKNGMMFVGWRHRDWKHVYYKPYQGEEGEIEIDSMSLTPSLYFTNPEGENDTMMMEGEVYFLPHFAFEYCEAKTKWEKKAMQLRHLVAAYNLYIQDDPETYKQAMESAADPDWRRWTSIMSDIKRHKDPLMKRKESNRRKRVAKVQKLRAAGVPESELDNHLSSDADSDSGFESDDDQGDVCMHSRRSKPGPMKPPPTPKRRNNGGNDPTPKKKRKPAPPQPSEDLQMSGTLNDLGDIARARARARDRSSSFRGVVNKDGRNDSIDYDPSPPERVTSSSAPSSSGSSSHGPDRGSGSGLFVSPAGDDSVDDRRNYEKDCRNRLSGYMQPTVEDYDGSVDDHDAIRWNGTMSERDAPKQAPRASNQPEIQPQEYDVVELEQARQASLQPEFLPQEDDDEDFEQAMQASLQPEFQPREDVVQSTENEDGLSEGNPGAWRRASSVSRLRGGSGRNRSVASDRGGSVTGNRSGSTMSDR